MLRFKNSAVVDTIVSSTLSIRNEVVSIPVKVRRLHQEKKPHRMFLIAISLVLLGYFGLAYLLMPFVWRGYSRWHPALKNCPTITETADGHPGDPINVGLIGDEGEVNRIIRSAGWYSADPLGLRSDLKIAADTVLERPYVDAPVSNLYLFGRREDLAFEKPVGHDPKQRHHVRFWKSTELDDMGRPLWFGSVTYDKRVGLSYTTGQITHHIDADIDVERDGLFDDLTKTGEIVDARFIDSFHKVREGHNGGGDHWYTDGRLRLGAIDH